MGKYNRGIVASGAMAKCAYRGNIKIQTAMLASVSALAVLAIATNASAQCAPDSAMDGDTVVCTGIDTDGFSAYVGSQPIENLLIIIEPTATINNAGSGFAVNFADGNIINNGVIKGTGTSPNGISAGSFLDALSVSVVNNGVIDIRETLTDPVSGAVAVSVTRGREFINRGNISIFTSEAFFGRLGLGIRFSAAPSGVSTFSNAGEILSQAFGVRVGRGISPSFGKPALAVRIRTAGFFDVDGSIDIRNSGSIKAIAPGNSTAFDIRGDISFTNTGEIIAEGDSGANSLMFSQARAIVYSDHDADSRSFLYNSGNIFAIRGDSYFNADSRFNFADRVTGNDSVAIELGGFGGEFSIENSGEINADIAINARLDSIQSVENSGRIIGDIFLRLGPDTIRNSGAIRGDIELGAGNDIFSQVAGGIHVGSVDGGNDFDVAAFEQFSGDVIVDDYLNFERLDVSTDGGALINNNAGVGPSFSELFIRSGRVAIEADLVLDVTVFKNGILGGNGSILGNVTSSGGVAPGASIGTLTINGDLTLDPPSILEIEFNSTISDQLIVSGDVMINGGTLVLSALESAPTSIQSFDFLTANSVIGDFSSVGLNGFSGFADVVNNGLGRLSFTVTPQIDMSLMLTPNALAVAAYINEFVINGTTNQATDDIFTSLFPLGDSEVAIQNALNALHPEAFAATAAIGVEQSLFLKELVRTRTSRFSVRGDGKYFWLSGAGSFAYYDGDLAERGTSSFEVNTNGIIGGMEIIRGDAMVGLYGGILNGEQEFRSLVVQTNHDGFVLGGYGAWSMGALKAGLSFDYAVGDIKTERTAQFLGETFRADYDFNTFNAEMQSQYEFTLKGLSIVPTVGLTYIRTDRDRAAESGGAAALEVAGATNNFLYLDIGGELSKDIRILDDMDLRVTGYTGWRYEALGHFIDALAGINGLDALGLEASGPSFDRSRVLVGGDVIAMLTEGVEAFIGYRGEFGEDYSKNRVRGGVTVRF